MLLIRIFKVRYMDKRANPGRDEHASPRSDSCAYELEGEDAHAWDGVIDLLDEADHSHNPQDDPSVIESLAATATVQKPDKDHP